jgi:transcriptional regulator with XRE-family HTH domain
MPTTTPTTNAGLRVRIRREALGLSRARLAALSGYSPAHIAQIEDGYVPRRGGAIETLELVMDEYLAIQNEQRPGGNRGAEHASDEGARHAASD